MAEVKKRKIKMDIAMVVLTLIGFKIGENIIGISKFCRSQKN